LGLKANKEKETRNKKVTFGVFYSFFLLLFKFSKRGEINRNKIIDRKGTNK
jgi:hypothetical protein